MEVPDKHAPAARTEADSRRLPAGDQAGLQLSERSDSSPAASALDRVCTDQAAAWITAKVASSPRRGAHEVGDYVLDRFFGGDAGLVRSRAPNKNASFRRLAEKCGTPELPVSKTWLNNAVGIALMLRRLPPSARAFKQLPPSYQETLLPLRDPAKVESVAELATTGELSFRALRDLVAGERGRDGGDASRSVRAAPPPAVKALRHAGRLLRFAPGDLDGLDERQRAAMRISVEVLLGRLNALAARLGRLIRSPPAK